MRIISLSLLFSLLVIGFLYFIFPVSSPVSPVSMPVTVAAPVVGAEYGLARFGLKTDTSKSSIDIRDIKDGGPGKDGIPSIDHPKFVQSSVAAHWVKQAEPVIVIDLHGIQRAYPLQTLMWHEIINDVIGETPVVTTFCPLCYSAVVFNRRLSGRVLEFGVSGLLRHSDMLMYDRQTESLWQQLMGTAVVGALTNDRLLQIPSQIMSFAQFRKRYPNGHVLSNETGYHRNYGVNPYVAYDDLDRLPMDRFFSEAVDKRLPPKERVLGIRHGGKQKIWNFSYLRSHHLYQGVFNSLELVIFMGRGCTSALGAREFGSGHDVGTVGVFSPRINGRLHAFTSVNGTFTDDRTTSVWDVTGYCTEGVLKGTQLKLIAHNQDFAFAWFAFFPQTEIVK